MSYHPRIPSLDDHYCQACSSSTSKEKHLSCFTCDHCQSSMCYECFDKHTKQLMNEFTQLQKRFLQLTNLFDDKRRFLGQFQEHCIRSVNSAFDEVVNDLQSLRRESIDYVRHQFNDAEAIISEILANVRPLIAKSQQTWTQDGITKNVMLEVEIQRKQINDIERRLDIFSAPTMNIKMSTYPRNKLELHCQPLLKSFTSTKSFSTNHTGKTISTRSSYRKGVGTLIDKIDVETEVEELNQTILINKQIQTDPIIIDNGNYIDDDDDDDYELNLQNKTDKIDDQINTENYLSTRFIQQGTILTQNEVDRIASDGEHLLYFSDTSRSLCYITDILSTKQANGTSTTKEISCRWPHHTILDLIYSPGSSQFVAATKTGVYTCTIINSTIDIQMQLTQHWSYVRLAADKNYIWLWTDTPRSNQLRTYSPKTFECIKIFNLNEHPRFTDNSTSFCIHTNILGTLFQFKQAPNVITYKKIFHLTLCDSTDLHELCTIRLGQCDIDHEIRVNHDGLFFITNGKKRLWIVDQYGRKEFVRLYRTGRALTAHNKNYIIIANGTQQLQCVEPSQTDNQII